MQKEMYCSAEKPPDMLLRGQPLSTWPEKTRQEYLHLVRGFTWEDAQGQEQRSAVYYDRKFEVYYLVKNEIVYGLTQNREIALEWLGH